MDEKKGRKSVVRTERVLVGASRDGKTYYVWHKCRGIGKKNSPIPCSYNKLAEKIRELLIEAGKIEV